MEPMGSCDGTSEYLSVCDATEGVCAVRRRCAIEIIFRAL